jgi:hypothetical protein
MEEQTIAVAGANLVAGWLGILLGFISGMLMGLCFHKEQWFGGYSSLKRRLYRLAHISFFGLGVVNLSFFITARALSVRGGMVTIASYCLLAGATGMPLCCVAMAHYPRTRLLFAVPVLSLLIGGLLTLVTVMQTELNPKEVRLLHDLKRLNGPGSYFPSTSQERGLLPLTPFSRGQWGNDRHNAGTSNQTKSTESD